jgi:hypothetical protein
VGFDAKKSSGSRETGAQAALPIWQEFIEETFRDQPPVPFPRSRGVSHASVDHATGARVETAGCIGCSTRRFWRDEPSRDCSAAEHARLRLPWILARYDLDDDGALVVPDDDLTALAKEPFMAVDPGRRTLSFTSPEGSATLRLHGVPGATPRMPAALEGKVDPAELLGKDGRPAEIVLLGESSRAETPPPSP